jgi:hypothetical protein
MQSEDIKNYSKWIIPIVVLVLIVGLIFFFRGGSNLNVTSAEGDEVFSVTDRGEIKITEDGTKYIVDPSKVKSGGPSKDGIPSIDNPVYISVEEANEWVEDDALVLAIVYKGVERAYPLQVMTWHEIVNDDISGDPVLITYCPLCGSGIAYERKINGEEVEFGTSGKLYSSNLVMYDRKTDTYWSQIDGLAIIGELTGMELKEISLDTVTWNDWKTAHPNTEVLSKNTGFSRNYDSDPYANYFADDFLFYKLPENVDDTGRISNKEFVFGIEIDGKYKAYRKVDVDTGGVIEDTFNGVNVKLEKLGDGRVIVTNIDTGEEIVKEVDFWFAWYGFHPTSELYEF